MTSCSSHASSCRELSNVSRTSAKLEGLREREPAKITSTIFVPRSVRADCSPSTQRTASSTLLLPQPLGPTIAVRPEPKSNSVRSAKLLNP